MIYQCSTIPVCPEKVCFSHGAVDHTVIILHLFHRLLHQPTDLKPVPLKAGEEEDYMLALKQEMRGTMQRLPYNLKPRSNRVGEEPMMRLKPDIEPR